MQHADEPSRSPEHGRHGGRLHGSSEQPGQPCKLARPRTLGVSMSDMLRETALLAERELLVVMSCCALITVGGSPRVRGAAGILF